jgi:hypothetical protein
MRIIVAQFMVMFAAVGVAIEMHCSSMTLRGWEIAKQSSISTNEV